LLCEPLETTANGKRLVVEDSAACQKTIQTPASQQVLKTDGASNLTWTNGANNTVLAKSSTGIVEFDQVQTAYIADSAVTTAKINDLAVTTAKIADNAVNTLEIANEAVTSAKLRDSAALSVIGRSANSTGVPADIAASITGSALVRNGTSLQFALIQESNIANGEITAPKLSGAQTGTAPIFGIRAWVSFNSVGAIEQSGNVSTVTKNATGDYTVVFDTALPTNSYAVMGSTSEVPFATIVIDNRTTTQCKIFTVDTSSTLVNKNRITVAFIV
jgi:hypothetical protein